MAAWDVLAIGAFRCPIQPSRLTAHDCDSTHLTVKYGTALQNSVRVPCHPSPSPMQSNAIKPRYCQFAIGVAMCRAPMPMPSQGCRLRRGGGAATLRCAAGPISFKAYMCDGNQRVATLCRAAHVQVPVRVASQVKQSLTER